MEGRADGEAAAQLSEAAQVELLELCEEHFVRLEKVNTHAPPSVTEYVPLLH